VLHQPAVFMMSLNRKICHTVKKKDILLINLDYRLQKKDIFKYFY